MSQGRAVFDDQHAFATDCSRIIHKEGRGGFDDDRIGVEQAQVLAHLDHILRVGSIHLIDHEDIRCADVGLAGVVAHFVPGAVRVSHHDLQVGHVEGEIVIPAVPQDDIHFLFSLAQDLLVIHAGVDDDPVIQVGLVFLAFLDGAFVLIQVGIIGEALDGLLDQIAIWHGVADGSHFVAHVAQDQRNPAGGLALTRTGANRANRDDRLGGFDLGGFRTHQAEIGPGGQHHGSLVHDHFMRHVAVGKDHLFHIFFWISFSKSVSA